MQIQKLFSDGQSLHKKGRVDAAKKIYRRVVQLEPNHAHALIFLALIEQSEGGLDAALGFAERAYSASRGDPLILVNYGILLKNARQFDLAIRVYNEALAVNPKLVSARANLATVYMLIGRLNDAEVEFKKVSQESEDVAPFLNLARIALAKDDIDEAEEYLKKAEALDPGHRDVPVVRALISKKDRNEELTFSSAVSALRKNPLSYETWQALRGVDADVLDLEIVDQLFSILLKTQSTNAGVFAAAVDLARKNMLWAHLNALEERLTQGLEAHNEIRGSSSDAFTLLGANISQKGHLRLSEYLWNTQFKSVEAASLQVQARGDEAPIKVGLLSYDFRNHAIGYLIVGLIESLPGVEAQYYAYSNSDDDGSETRRRISSSVHRFTNVSKLDDSELSDVIQRDGIDILIDLSQMTSGTRASVMRYRPAPIQMQWLGMPGTLGAKFCDYIIADRWVIDDENRDGFSETPLLLDRSYQPNDHIKPDLTLGGARADHGLPEEDVVFCSFNQHYKFSPDTAKLWGRIMTEVPNSVLWLLKSKAESHKEHLLDVLASYGVPRDRVVFADHKPQKEHIARIAHADLILDTWPYNAHTTCSDALRAGVPVVTLPGKVFASRVAQGILETGNLSEWVAQSADEYVEIAIAYGRKSREDIDLIKKDVFDTYWSSRMVDNEAFGKMFENMLVEVSRRHSQLSSAATVSVATDGSVTEIASKGGDVKELRSDGPEVEALKESGVSAVVQKNVGRDRIQNLKILKSEVIGLRDLPLLVDVGAADFAWDKSETADLVESGCVRVLGFEPDDRSFRNLTSKGGENRLYLNQAVGNGRTMMLNLCNGAHMSSLLEPNYEVLEDLLEYSSARIVDRVSIGTVRLDDVIEARSAKMLKIDVQGFELSILENAEELLNELLIVQFEASFLPMYIDQPSLFKIGAWLEGRGFSMLKFAKFNYQNICTPKFDSKGLGKSQLLEVDAVFVPSPDRWSHLDADEVKTLAFLLHSTYRAYDVSLRLLWTLDQRDGGSRSDAYNEYLKEAGLYA